MKKASKNLLTIVILSSLFFIFGFITWLNSSLIPYLKISCQLNDFQSSLVTFAFYISYFVTALPSSWVLKKTGLKKGMMFGLWIMSLGAFLFIPAAISREYILFLIALFTIGVGLSLLQTASNPYVTLAGSIDSAAKRISIMGIFNKIAGMSAPILLGSFFLLNIDSIQDSLNSSSLQEKEFILNELSNRVVLPYIIIGITLFLLGLMIQFSPLPNVEDKEQSYNVDGTQKKIWHYPYLVLGVISIFLYVGAEVISIDMAVTYGQLQGYTLLQAQYFPSYSLMAMVIAYVIGAIVIPKFITQQRALIISSIFNIICVFFAMFTNGYYSLVFFLSLGFGNALMWPAIWPLSIRDLGKHTKTASAILIMAIVGGAVIPPFFAYLTQQISSEFSLIIPLFCYLFILFYGLKGNTINQWKK